MKLSVLLITGESDKTALDTMQNIAGQTGNLAKEIFLIIAGDFAEEDRKKLFLERSSSFGMTAFINVGDKSDAELLGTFIKYANADFITVMRAGGRADPDYFDRLISALEQDDSQSIAFGVRISGTADIFTPSKHPAGTIDLASTYGCFPRSLEGTVIRTSYAAQHSFDISAGEYADQKGMLTMLCGCDKIYFDSSLKIWAADKASTTDESPEAAQTGEYHTAFFTQCLLPLEESCKGKDGRLPLFLQHFITAEVFARVKEGMKLKSFPAKDREIVLNTLTTALKPVEDKVICAVYGVAPAPYDIIEKRIMLGLKHGHENYFTDIAYSRDKLFATQKDIVLFDSSKLFIRVDLINARKGCLELDGSFASVFGERRVRVVAEYDGEEHKLLFDRKGDATYLFGAETLRNRSFHLTLPVNSEERAELRFFILFKGCKYELKCSFGSPLGRLVDNSYDSFYPIGNGVFAIAEGGRIVTLPMSKREQQDRFDAAMEKAKEGGLPHRLRSSFKLTRRWFKNKNIWIFADDTEQGGGAAEDMFRYAMTRHDELYCYYLTDKKSEAAQRLIADGYKPLYTGTLLHKLLFLNAQAYITTKPDVMYKNLPSNADIHYSLPRTTAMHTIMLQNSPTDKPTAKNSRLHDNVRLYFCGTGDYLEELKKPVYGYEYTDVLKLTGLTSYDSIKDLSGKDKLLLMLASFDSEEDCDFEETAFFGRIKTLLENKKLIEALAKSGYTLTIAIKGLTKDDGKKLPKQDKVTLLTGDFDAVELKGRASLIVTDDGDELSAGLMRKPLIYFGGVNGHSFGEAAATPKKLAELLCWYLENGMTIKPELAKKAEEYFGNDGLGCRRAIYNEIISYLYENGDIDSYEDFEEADKYDEE